jgi:hypothetical protein
MQAPSHSPLQPHFHPCLCFLFFSSIERGSPFQAKISVLNSNVFHLPGDFAHEKSSLSYFLLSASQHQWNRHIIHKNQNFSQLHFGFLYCILLHISFTGKLNISFAGKWIELEVSTLSEKNQAQKDKHCMGLLNR